MEIKYSAPEILLSDQGAQFKSKLVQDICDYLRTKKIFTTAYHPQCNGLTERFNATLCQMLSIYGNNNQDDWDEHIPAALFSYRTSAQETTNLSPFEVLFGRQPQLPSDFEFLRSQREELIIDFKKNWEEAHNKIARANSKRKEKFDQKLPRKEIKIGDKIRLYMPAVKVGLKDKLRGNKWDGPFRVVGKFANGNLKIKIPDKEIYITYPEFN